MHIANPIYDVVFKYLMEDAKIAKLLISSIIGEEIETLDFLPQEFTADLDTGIVGKIGLLTVYRLDFSATIKSADGLKQVLIEIQKAKYATDIMRFRGYLGSQYSNKNNTTVVTINDHERRIGIPIIGIYFLGHKLDSTDASIIGVNRAYKDLVTGELLTVKESFIESLTHDSYVIQIPNLAQKRRNDLEKLLSIFDQSMYVDAEHHMLNIKEEEYPEKHRSLIRRLQAAILEPEMRKQMEIEDGILDEFEDMQRRILQLRQKTAEAEKRTDVAMQKIVEAERETNEARQKTVEAERETDEARQRITQVEREADEARRETAAAEHKAEVARRKTTEAEHGAKKEVARKLKTAAVPMETIMQATGLSREEVEEI
jgi:hypothetical protein